MNAVFRSKIDAGFTLIALAMPCVALVALFTAPPGKHLVWIPVVMVFLVAAFVCWIFVATYYELREEELVAHCGPFTWRVPLASVIDVRESNTARSGPALSMDRLEIVYGDGRMLIVSPADKVRFLTALSRRTAAVSASAAGPISRP